MIFIDGEFRIIYKDALIKQSVILDGGKEQSLRSFNTLCLQKN